MGPSKGMPESIRAAEAALMARTSWGLTWSAPKMVPTTWTSLRKPLGNEGRSGRSISRQVRMAWSEALALPAEERAGDLAGRVRPLLDVDGQGEEVGPLAHRPGGGGGGQQDGVADAGRATAPSARWASLPASNDSGAVGAADRARHGDGFSHGAPRVLGGTARPVPSGRPPRSARTPRSGGREGDRRLAADAGGARLLYDRPAVRPGGRPPWA